MMSWPTDTTYADVISLPFDGLDGGSEVIPWPDFAGRFEKKLEVISSRWVQNFETAFALPIPWLHLQKFDILRAIAISCVQRRK